MLFAVNVHVLSWRMAQITGQYVCAAGGNSFQPNVVTITYVSIKPRFVEDYFEKATKIERYFECMKILHLSLTHGSINFCK